MPAEAAEPVEMPAEPAEPAEPVEDKNEDESEDAQNKRRAFEMPLKSSVFGTKNSTEKARKREKPRENDRKGTGREHLPRLCAEGSGAGGGLVQS